MSARQGVGAYGDPAALDEWVENQGRSEGRRESRVPARNPVELRRASRVAPRRRSFESARRYIFVMRYLAEEKFALRSCDGNVIALSSFLALAKSFASVFALLPRFSPSRVCTCFASKAGCVKSTVEQSKRCVFGEVC